jgi:alpha-tubulin suppressor-like RCC1 family protein
MARRRPGTLHITSLSLAGLLAGCSATDTTRPLFVTLEIVSGTNQTGYVGANLLEPLVVRARNERGESVPGVRLSWTVLSGGGSVIAIDTETDAQGHAAASFRLGNTLGQQSAQAFAFQSEGLPVRFDATATPAPASTLTLISGGGQTATAGTTLPQEIAIRLNDAFGNVVPGTEVSFTVTAGGGATNVPSAVSDNAGVVKFRWTLGPVAGTQSVAATIFGVTPLIITATANAASPSQVSVVSGSGQSAPPGTELAEPLVVQVRDQFGNPLPNVNVAWTPVGAGAGTVTPATSLTNQAGQASTRWTVGATGGAKEVRAAAAGISGHAVFQGAGHIRFQFVSAGRYHSCGFDQAGTGYCWGLFGDGQLGVGAAPSGSGPSLTAPFQVAQGAMIFAGSVLASSSGGSHTCAVILGSDAYCWGKNSDGRLGNGGTSNATSPVKVSGTGYVSISAGGLHTCARTGTDRVYCWGQNNDGQAGASGATLSPVLVAPGQMFISVSAGGNHSCAIETGGAAWCWGSNSKGQLGASGNGGSTPVAVEGGFLFTAVVAGDRHSCALTADGAVYCWGDNNAGQLGANPLVEPTRATPAPAAPGFAFVAIAAGLEHTCGLTGAGLAYCWGRNSSGELGDGSSTGSWTPVAVGGGHTFATISGGDRHTCGVTTNQIAWCWGSNQYGQIGSNGAGSFFSLPVKVAYQP